MNRLLILSVLLSTLQLATLVAGRCNRNGAPCRKEYSDEWVQDDEKICKKAKGCCWTGKKCVQEETEPKKVDGKPGNKGNPIPFPEDFKEKARRLPIGPPIFPGCPGPAPFPSQCFPKRNEPYVLEPPMNIPYCQRIPCSTDRRTQAKLDLDLRSCGVQPGCYFDRELSEYREAFGRAVLPGVPVCHLAIRSKVLQREAQNVISMYGFWNPFFTNCFLNTFDEELMEGPPGCKLIPLMEVFKVYPKLAGWEGIVSSECAYIGGCWRHNLCVYPLNPKKLVNEAEQKYEFNQYEIPFGRQKCQHFDPSTPYSSLLSYHNCLSAGCSVDTSVTVNYYHNLFAIGNAMDAKDHWVYWEQVLNGFVGPYNIEEIPWYYNKDKVKFGAPPPPPPRLPKPEDESDPGMFFSLPGQPSGRRLPPLPPKRGKSYACGHIFKLWGYRPCPPPEIPPMHYNKYCPYKPVSIPRFPKLKGSFDGCCEINKCYLSKRDIRDAYSGPSTYITKWSSYSPCSVSCGAQGYQYRYRKKVGPLTSGKKDIEKDRKKCYVTCAEWSDWGNWGRCSSHQCARQTRTRECVPRNAHCQGKSEQSQLCDSADWWCN